MHIKPLLSVSVYRGQIRKSVSIGIAVLAVSLLIGILGYRFTTGMGWLDALHNASMILSGMGPVVEIKTKVGKLFSSFYALFSGVIFITNIGIILGPAIHRFFHRMHIQISADEQS
jgi:hypothetical protein